MCNEINEIPTNDKSILTKLRTLLTQSGGSHIEQNHLNTVQKVEGINLQDGEYCIEFNRMEPFGRISSLYTKEGSYNPYLSGMVGDTNKFWELLNQDFVLTPVINQYTFLIKER